MAFDKKNRYLKRIREHYNECYRIASKSSLCKNASFELLPAMSTLQIYTTSVSKKINADAENAITEFINEAIEQGDSDVLRAVYKVRMDLYYRIHDGHSLRCDWLPLRDEVAKLDTPILKTCATLCDILVYPRCGFHYDDAEPLNLALEECAFIFKNVYRPLVKEMGYFVEDML